MSKPGKPNPRKRLRGWRRKRKQANVIGVPNRDISYQEALKNPDLMAKLKSNNYNKYFRPVYTRPDRGEH